MLAVPGIPSDDLRSYSAEPKLDGWRVMVGLDRDHGRVSTRRGARIPNFGSWEVTPPR